MSFNIKGIVILLIVFIMLFLFTNNILYELAKKKCTEVEIKPVRYEYSGLFGDKKIMVETTEENKDGYGRICIKTGEPKFKRINLFY